MIQKKPICLSVRLTHAVEILHWMPCLALQNLKHQKSRREQFSQSSAATPTLPPSALQGHHSMLQCSLLSLCILLCCQQEMDHLYGKLLPPL